MLDWWPRSPGGCVSRTNTATAISKAFIQRLSEGLVITPICSSQVLMLRMGGTTYCFRFLTYYKVRYANFFRIGIFALYILLFSKCPAQSRFSITFAEWMNKQYCSLQQPPNVVNQTWGNLIYMLLWSWLLDSINSILTRKTAMHRTLHTIHLLFA